MPEPTNRPGEFRGQLDDTTTPLSADAVQARFAIPASGVKATGWKCPSCHQVTPWGATHDCPVIKKGDHQ